MQQARQYRNYNVHRSNALRKAYIEATNSMKPVTVNQKKYTSLHAWLGYRLMRDDKDDREYELYSACMNAHGIYWKVER